MLLVGDETQAHGRFPWVTGSLIGINVIVFCAQSLIGDSFTTGFSLIPYEITHLTDLTKPEKIKVKQPVRAYYVKGKTKIEYRDVWVDVPQAPGPFPIFLTLLTSMFMHGDWWHLIGNMWFLALFGRNVECALDHGRFLAFYIGCGVIGGLIYTVFDPNSVIPCLGASGAISGVMGAYVAIYPLNYVKVWFGVYFGVVEVPAFLVVGVWFLFQYLAAFASLETAGNNLGGVAYWDHIGGFVAGVAMIRIAVYYLRRKEAERQAAEEAGEESLDEPLQPTSAAELNALDRPPIVDPFANFLPKSPK